MKLNNFSNYEIDPFKGTIFNLKTNKYLFGSPDKDGYMRIGLRDDTGVRRYFKIHRLFWTLVNGEIPEGYHIHHINGSGYLNDFSAIFLFPPLYFSLYP